MFLLTEALGEKKINTIDPHDVQFMAGSRCSWMVSGVCVIFLRGFCGYNSAKRQSAPYQELCQNLEDCPVL